MRPWHPEHPVSAALATRLVHAQFPELRGLAAVRVGEGWDTDVWRFGDLAFRFPRRAFGVRTVNNELAVLGALATYLPLAIPVPTHRGTATEAYPHAFYGHRFLQGRTADAARLDEAARAAVTPALARFLRSLHAVPVAQAREIGVRDDPERAGVARRVAQVRRDLEDLRGQLDAPTQGEIEHRLRGLAPETRETSCVLHGDLYARHLLLNPQDELTGIIDWGDVCCGESSADLSILYTYVPKSAQEAFLGIYGAVSADTLMRAAFIALCYGVRLMAYATAQDDADLLEAGRLALVGALSAEVAG